VRRSSSRSRIGKTTTHDKARIARQIWEDRPKQVHASGPRLTIAKPKQESSNQKQSQSDDETYDSSAKNYYSAMKTTRRTQLGKTTALLGLVGMLAAPAIQAQQQPALDCSFRGDPIAANDAVSFHHILNQVDKTLTVEVTYQGEGWVGFGISQDGLMPGSQVVIAKPDEAQGSSNPGKYEISARSQFSAPSKPLPTRSSSRRGTAQLSSGSPRPLQKVGSSRF
jgi:hypothetical protein